MESGDQNIEDQTIPIIFDAPEDIRDSKGLSDAYERATRKLGDLNITVFQEKLTTLCLKLSEAIHSLDSERSEYFLESFEVNVDVTAKGEVRLIGSVSSEVKGGIRLVFKKAHTQQ